MAEQKALSRMQNVIGADRKRGNKKIFGFLGCMAQSRGGELIDQLPGVDLVLGTQKTHRTGEYLDALLSGSRDKVVDTADEPGSESAIREHLGHGVGNDSRPVTAFVSIMQGCNQHCTFCIVPSTPG